MITGKFGVEMKTLGEFHVIECLLQSLQKQVNHYHLNTYSRKSK